VAAADLALYRSICTLFAGLSMLFHTWPFFVFALVVLPVYFLLRGPLGRLRLWIPWLMAASYFFYGWWNPYYLILVFYSTLLDYLLVALMDHCPPAARRLGFDVVRALGNEGAGSLRVDDSRDRAAGFWGGFSDSVLKWAFLIASGLTVAIVLAAIFGPATLRPALFFLAALVALMAVGARLANRRIWLIISLVNNLALLLFFKYARFVVENVNDALGAIHTSIHVADPSTLMPFGSRYLLPVGISFFTFQSLSYTIDFYFGKAQRERNFLRFATFVCFFPQLMAGPIERARHLLPQFRSPPPLRLADFTDGMSLFLVGLFKKLALANFLAKYVDQVYDTPGAYDATALTLATVAFAWQIFFDFSGYTDMARGLAKMMGFNLILNFNNPYLATGLGDFWARWHISLSTWFRDYVYIPLGGSRRGSLITYRNLFITFLISGIWHGAAWTFVIWGVLHAAGIMLTRELERSDFYRERVPAVFKRIWVFAYVCFAWIFFRAPTVNDAMMIVKRIFTALWSRPQMPALMMALILMVWAYQFMYESRLRGLLRLSAVRVSLAVCMMLYICLCSSGGGTFIYFQF
jgi:alginate O-acetyltransferase complex protein AlgI